jgi:hypothetical protein
VSAPVALDARPISTWRHKQAIYDGNAY